MFINLFNAVLYIVDVKNVHNLALVYYNGENLIPSRTFLVVVVAVGYIQMIKLFNYNLLEGSLIALPHTYLI